jgi:hypothetical protein
LALDGGEWSASLPSCFTPREKAPEPVWTQRLGEEYSAAYKILVGKPEEKRPHGRLRHRSKDTIKMYVKEIGCEDVDYIHLTHDKVQLQVVRCSSHLA